MSNDFNFESAKLSGNECYAAQILGFHGKYFPWTSQTSRLLLADILAAFLKKTIRRQMAKNPRPRRRRVKVTAGRSISTPVDVLMACVSLSFRALELIESIN